MNIKQLNEALEMAVDNFGLTWEDADMLTIGPGICDTLVVEWVGTGSRVYIDMLAESAAGSIKQSPCSPTRVSIPEHPTPIPQVPLYPG